MNPMFPSYILHKALQAADEAHLQGEGPVAVTRVEPQEEATRGSTLHLILHIDQNRRGISALSSFTYQQLIDMG